MILNGCIRSRVGGKSAFRGAGWTAMDFSLFGAETGLIAGELDAGEDSMLVLKRKCGEVIFIDQFAIVVTAVHYSKGQEKSRVLLQFEKRGGDQNPIWKKTCAIEDEVSLAEDGVDAMVMITDIYLDCVKLGIVCPKETVVLRKEVCDRDLLAR